MTESKNYVAIARRYAEDVIAGRILACEWTIKACRRQIADLERAETDQTWPYVFNPKTRKTIASRREKVGPGNYICEFVEMMPQIKGDWANRNERLDLQPWQVFIYTTVFGWVYRRGYVDPASGRDLSGMRRFRTAYLEMGRKNGKCLELKTPIPTPSGWSTIGDLSVGDTVYGIDGRPCRVTAVSDIYTDHQCYMVRFSNGESVVADAGHLWRTHRVARTRTTEEIFRTLTAPGLSDADRRLELPGPYRKVRIVGVDPVDTVPVKCIQVDSPSAMFLFGRTKLPTHNSTLSAPMGIYMMSADGESGAEVYCAATTREQTRAVWLESARPMVEREAGLRATFGIATSAHSIFQTSTNSFFRPLCAEGNSLDSLNIHCAIIDELHAHRTRKVYDVLASARGARLQPLLWLITTAGFDRSGICYEQRTYVTKILDNVVADETYFGVIYTLDADDDWRDDSTWKKANPNLDISVYSKELRAEAAKAAAMPSALNNFLTKYLSVWVNAGVALYDMVKWQALADPSLEMEDFKEDPCWIGLDFAPQWDFSNRVALFRREQDDGIHYYVFARHFLSEGKVEESENAQYVGWARDGWIRTNPGNQTDDRELEDDIVMLVESGFQVQELDCDPSRVQGIQTRAYERTGVKIVDIFQNRKNLSTATEKLSGLIADGKIHHNGDPVLAWMLSNVIGTYDRGGRVYPERQRPENKIDGVTALITALSRAIVADSSGSMDWADDPLSVNL